MKRSYLKMRRKALHKTLEDIAYDIGVSYNYLLNIENGHQGDKASFILMVKIAKAYQINIDEFHHQECLYQKEKGVLKDYD
jgi:transcriptional regulator with XRE-family HTH domain